MIQDHQGKTSQGRVSALLSTISGLVYSLAPIFMDKIDRYDIDVSVLMVLLAGPGALMLWQKLAAPQERVSSE